MGGQACVFYGAAEFTRDLDLLILADSENLGRLRVALADLEAEPIAVPLSMWRPSREVMPHTLVADGPTWPGFSSI